ncbi:MAG: hypothetical protein ACT4P5_06625, partial [Armatimonadota bacterium]
SADSQNPGPLANDPRVAKGQILRLGLTTNPKIPATVRLDEVAKQRARALADRIADLQARLAAAVSSIEDARTKRRAC